MASNHRIILILPSTEQICGFFSTSYQQWIGAFFGKETGYVFSWSFIFSNDNFFFWKWMVFWEWFVESLLNTAQNRPLHFNPQNTTDGSSTVQVECGDFCWTRDFMISGTYKFLMILITEILLCPAEVNTKGPLISWSEEMGVRVVLMGVKTKKKTSRRNSV